MKDSFDDIIKKTLEDHTIIPEDASWDLFKHKMEVEQEMMSDESLDSLVKNQFSSFEAPYKSSHWNILRNKLRLQARNLENLYVSKAFEFITFILLLMTFMQHGFKSQTTPTQKFDTNTFAQQDAKVNDNTDLSNGALTTTLAKATPAEINQNQFSLSPVAMNQKISHPTYYPQGVNNADHQSRLVAVNIPTATHVISSQNAQQGLATYITTAQSSDFVVSDLSLIPAKLILLDVAERPNIQIEQSKFLTVVNEASETAKSISVFASFDNNLINTPADEVYKNIEEVLFDAPGMSLGATYDLKLNEVMEVSAGLGYSRVAYSPQLIEERFLDVTRGGTYNLFLDKIQYDMVQVPLHMKLNVLRGENWSVFTQLGVTGSLITNSKYETVAEVIYLPRDTPSAAQELRNPYNNFYKQSSNQPKLYEKHFSSGVFQGGIIKNNIHLTANVGLGFTRKLSDKVSVFSLLNLKNPTLNFEIGPNQDRLGSLSLSAGAQLRI